MGERALSDATRIRNQHRVSGKMLLARKDGTVAAITGIATELAKGLASSLSLSGFKGDHDYTVSVTITETSREEQK